MFDREKLAAQLKIDEGVSLKIYRDSYGMLAVGVGHLLPQLTGHFSVGQSIAQAQCDAYFDADITNACNVCRVIWPAFDTYPDAAQQVLANMAFSLGGARLQGFYAMIAMVKAQRWNAAAVSGEHSPWYRQVGARGKRLMDRLRALDASAP